MKPDSRPLYSPAVALLIVGLAAAGCPASPFSAALLVVACPLTVISNTRGIGRRQ